MKQKIPLLEGEKVHEYVFEKVETKDVIYLVQKNTKSKDFNNTEIFKPIEDVKTDKKIHDADTFESAKKGDLVIRTVQEVEELPYKIKEPQFDQLAAAFSEMSATPGKVKMPESGKVIWETCCVEYDERITPSILLKICLDLYVIYVTPFEGTIKKK